MLTALSSDPKAWTSGSLSREDWLLTIPVDCLAELEAVAAALTPAQLAAPTGLSPDQFALARCRAFAATVRERIDRFPGFALLDRLPVDRLGVERSTALYWLISSLIGRPVAQSYSGTLLYDVRDTGKKIAAAVRGDLTNQELYWHTDYGFNRQPPHRLGLLVLATAKEGGISQIISFHSVHDRLLQRHPDLLPRLYEPFYWNRQREHGPDEPLTYRHPVFTVDDELRARFNRRLIHVGHEIAGEPIDPAGQAALAALGEALEDPALHLEFVLEPGQIQYLNNRACCHRRTAYVDHEPPTPRRHLVRIFLRDTGGPGYDG